MGKLTELKVRNLAEPGRYGDGDGLWFQIRKPDADRKAAMTEPAKSWIYRYTWHGRQRQLGLGSYPVVGLKAARDAAYEAARQARAGVDPIEEKKAKKATDAAMSFSTVLDLYLKAHESTWKNLKHRQQWKNTLETYAVPVFGSRLVSAVDTGAVMKAIEPIWHDKPETASRVRGRIETILDYATARGWRTGDNPARWRGHVENLLPARSSVAKVEHHAALPWEEIGSFLDLLSKQAGTAALALQFTILTATRTGESTGARWSEIDLGAKTWTIPAERMKAGVQHRVPLTDAALDILRTMLPGKLGQDGYVFPGAKKDAGLSNMSMAAVLKRMKRDDITVHGFRSTFRQWAGDRTSVAREVAEAALAHTVRDKTEAAYARSDLFERRRKLMEHWATFCSNVEVVDGKVVSIGQAA